MTVHDSRLELVTDGCEKAEALEVYVEVGETMSYVGLDRSDVHGLVNGSAATVKVVPVNISGQGGPISESETPAISWENAWEPITVDSDDGKVILGDQLMSPPNRGNGYYSRSVTFNIHRGTSPNVDTSGDPVASLDSGEEAIECRFTWEDTTPANDGTLYYYNVQVKDRTFEGADVPNPTLSEPHFDAGMEVYSNAAKPLENLISDDPSTWVSGQRYQMTLFNGTFYYTTHYEHGSPSRQGFAGESP